MKKRTKKIIVAAAVVPALVLLVLAGGYFKARRQMLAQFDVLPRTTEASQGDIGVYVASSGNLYTAGETRVKAGTLGEVLSLEAKAGKTVKAGQVLAVVDGGRLADDIEALENQIFDQEIAIAQISDSRERLYIKAEAAGTIKDIKAGEGDDVEKIMEKYGYLALLSLQDKEYVVVGASADFLTKGAELEVKRGDTVIGGAVDKVENGKAYVLIETDSFTVGGRAYVYPPGEYAKRVQGLIELYDYIKVKAYRGTISSVSCREDEEQIIGETLFSAYSYYSQTVIDMYRQLDDLREELADKKQMLESLEIRAPHAGVVTECSLAEGDVITDEDAAVFTIADTGIWEAKVGVDELDINSVEPGQKAIIYVDALPGYEFAGTVYEISSAGTAANGITSYEVRIRVPDEQGLFKLNMTVSADIETDYSQNTVRIPVEALRISGGTAYVVADAHRTEAEIAEIRSALTGGAAGPGMPPRARAGQFMQPGTEAEQAVYSLSIADRLYGEVIEVQTGIQNESYIEVLSGLKAGDVLILPEDDSDESDMPPMFGGGMFGPGR